MGMPGFAENGFTVNYRRYGMATSAVRSEASTINAKNLAKAQAREAGLVPVLA
jgi:hypothetical protein